MQQGKKQRGKMLDGLTKKWLKEGRVTLTEALKATRDIDALIMMAYTKEHGT